MHVPHFNLGGFVNALMGRLDRNHNGYISIAAHGRDPASVQRMLAVADSQWTPFDFGSTRGDGIVTRHELAKAMRDHVDLNHDNRIGPRERHWARVSFGI